jgi:transposase-like protein
VWFRAIFEISARRNGISAKELQRIMGFGSYMTAWTWLHKLRAAMVRSGSEPLGPLVEMDETLVGGKGSPIKELVLVAAERNGRVRLAHAANNDEATLKTFAEAEIAPRAQVVTDGHAAYNRNSLAERSHEPHVQSKQERRADDAVQRCHWMVSNLKRWLLGTHGGAVRPKYLQAYLDEFTFRYNRRKTYGVGRIAARTIASLVSRPARTIADITGNSAPYMAFRS